MPKHWKALAYMMLVITVGCVVVALQELGRDEIWRATVIGLSGLTALALATFLFEAIHRDESERND